LFTEIATSLGGETPSLVPTPPYQHQADAVTKAVEHFVSLGNARGKFIGPCGSGEKSLGAYCMARSCGAKRVVVAVPSLFLIGQTLRTRARSSASRWVAAAWLAGFLKTSLLSANDCLMLIALSTLPLFRLEVRKVFVNRTQRSRHPPRPCP
jgi:predicted helicase